MHYEKLITLIKQRNFVDATGEFEYFGEAYINDIIDSPDESIVDWDWKKLEKDWFESLKFFLELAFKSYLSDHINNRMYNHAILSIEKTIKEMGISKEDYPSFDENVFRRIEHIAEEVHFIKLNKKSDFIEEQGKDVPLIHNLTNPLPNGQFTNKFKTTSIKPTNPKLYLILDTLRFIHNHTENGNIYNWIVENISKNRIPNDILDREIFSISDATISRILRDASLIESELKKKLSGNIASNTALFTADGPVINVASLCLGCTTCNSPEKTKIFFIKAFNPFNIPKFAAGIWYVETTYKITERCKKWI